MRPKKNWEQSDTAHAFLGDFIRRADKFVAYAKTDLEHGHVESAKAMVAEAAQAVRFAAVWAGVELRRNPGEESTTTAQTHIREALAHLAQAEKDAGKQDAPTALEQLDAAAEHIGAAVERIGGNTKADANPCRPERNSAATTRAYLAGWAAEKRRQEREKNPPTWNPSPLDNPFRMDRWALDAYRKQAKARGLQAVAWKHPTAGYIFTHSKGHEAFAEFKKRQAERIAGAGGKVVKWYPVRSSSSSSSRKNPPPPRQLVRLGDVLEIHLANGKGLRWGKGEAALLTQPGTEKEARGKGRLILAPLRAVKGTGGAGPHKTSERTYETWHGKLPTASKSQVADVPGLDEFTKAIGQVKAVVYSSTKWQTRAASYIHDFEAPLPRLYAGPKGTYEIRGGGFRVTARGIVG